MCYSTKNLNFTQTYNLNIFFLNLFNVTSTNWVNKEQTIAQFLQKGGRKIAELEHVQQLNNSRLYESK
jgi:hypothetical protein